ncbi:MAG: MBL fold metallo-hydrolase [Spirochaetota bacterium]|nr:MBL fold metallo-hydrolase [Spirochaetota bacterium]
MEITDGIHRVEGLKGVNAYFLINNEGVILIDTGMPGNAERIITQVKSLGKGEDDITHIIITHADIDHCGSAADLKKMTGAKLAIHEGDAASICGETELKKVKGFMKVIFNTMSLFMRFVPIKPDIILQDGDEIDGLKIYHIPGHTNGSICIYKPNKAIFTGDAIITIGKGGPRGPMGIFTLDMAQAWESINRLNNLELEYDILLPGHGNPLTHNASLKVKELKK